MRQIKAFRSPQGLLRRSLAMTCGSRRALEATTIVNSRKKTASLLSPHECSKTTQMTRLLSHLARNRLETSGNPRSLHLWTSRMMMMAMMASCSHQGCRKAEAGASQRARKLSSLTTTCCRRMWKTTKSCSHHASLPKSKALAAARPGKTTMAVAGADQVEM